MFRVINVATTETAAELSDREIAIGVAKQLAIESEHRERWIVEEIEVIFDSHPNDKPNGIS